MANKPASAKILRHTELKEAPVHVLTILQEPNAGTRDTCRELELIPGEVHASYLNLNERITVRLDIFVDSAARATTDFKAFLPLLDRRELVDDCA